MTEQELLEAAMRLPPESWARLADMLAESVHTGELSEIEHAWLEVAKRRLDEVEQGLVQTIPIEEGLQQVRDSHRK